MTLGVGPDQLEVVLRLVASIGLSVLVPKPAEFVQKTMVLPCESPESGIRVGLVFSFSPYEQQAMDRVRRIRVLDQDVRFASPEDLMVHKIIAGRPRDLEDARAVLAKNPGMDKAYIERWLGDFEKALNRPLLEAWKKLRTGRKLHQNIEPAGSPSMDSTRFARSGQARFTWSGDRCTEPPFGAFVTFGTLATNSLLFGNWYIQTLGFGLRPQPRSRHNQSLPLGLKAEWQVP